MSVRWRSTKDIYDPHFALKQELILLDTTVLADAATASAAAIAAGPVEFLIALSDETTALAVAAGLVEFRMPYDFTLQSVRSNVTTAPTDASLVIDFLLNGVTIFGGKLTIDPTEETSLDSSVAETLATGTVTLDSGASGSVDGILVDGVEVMSGAENFDTDLDTTAVNVAANITANTSSPNYTATAASSVVTISAIAGTGSSPNTFTVVSSVTTIGTTDVAMASGVYAQATLVTTAFSSDDIVTFDIIQVGSTIEGAGLQVMLQGIRA